MKRAAASNSKHKPTTNTVANNEGNAETQNEVWRSMVVNYNRISMWDANLFI